MPAVQFVFFTSVPILVKIHQKCECESARKWTRGQRKAGFIICPMLYAIAIGQIMIYVTYTSVTSMSVRVLHRQKCNSLHRMLPPGESRWACQRHRQTDRQTDVRQIVTLRFPLDMA